MSPYYVKSHSILFFQGVARKDKSHPKTLSFNKENKPQTYLIVEYLKLTDMIIVTFSSRQWAEQQIRLERKMAEVGFEPTSA